MGGVSALLNEHNIRTIKTTCAALSQTIPRPRVQMHQQGCASKAKRAAHLNARSPRYISGVGSPELPDCHLLTVGSSTSQLSLYPGRQRV